MSMGKDNSRKYILELYHKSFKTTIIQMLQQATINTLETNEIGSSWQRYNHMKNLQLKNLIT